MTVIPDPGGTVMDLCAAATIPPRPGQPDGSTCREWDGRQPGWAAAGPLCATEVAVAARDVPMLLWDVVDLAQMAPKPVGQALDGQPAARPGPPMPVAAGPDALQAEIAHVLTTWEEVVREHARLSPLPARGVNAPWHTTVTRRPPLARVRVGAAVQRATTVLAPRLELLARIPATAVQPCGVEDAWADVAGWEAVLHLSRLRARARAMLGRTRRTTRVPGSCSYPDPGGDPKRSCGGDLFRDEPRYEHDPCDVRCGRCERGRWSADEYERYVGFMLALPVREAAA